MCFTQPSILSLLGFSKACYLFSQTHFSLSQENEEGIPLAMCFFFYFNELYFKGAAGCQFTHNQTLP